MTESDGLNQNVRDYIKKRNTLIEQEKQELVSDCCSAMVVTRDNHTFVCHSCQKICEVYLKTVK